VKTWNLPTCSSDFTRRVSTSF